MFLWKTQPRARNMRTPCSNHCLLSDESTRDTQVHHRRSSPLPISLKLDISRPDLPRLQTDTSMRLRAFCPAPNRPGVERRASIRPLQSRISTHEIAPSQES